MLASLPLSQPSSLLRPGRRPLFHSALMPFVAARTNFVPRPPPPQTDITHTLTHTGNHFPPSSVHSRASSILHLVLKGTRGRWIGDERSSRIEGDWKKKMSKVQSCQCVGCTDDPTCVCPLLPSHPHVTHMSLPLSKSHMRD